MARIVLLLSLCLICLYRSAFAETRTIYATRFYNSYDHRIEVLARIKPGDTVITRTLDAAGYDQNTKKLADPSNPLTGPFYIEGAEPGDAIAVTFTRMRMNRNFGWSAFLLGQYSIKP